MQWLNKNVWVSSLLRGSSTRNVNMGSLKELVQLLNSLIEPRIKGALLSMSVENALDKIVDEKVCTWLPCLPLVKNTNDRTPQTAPDTQHKVTVS